jgi:ATP-dependent Clp protease ATP-binding subunit ClpA
MDGRCADQGNMEGRFTDQGREAVALARVEAGALGDDTVEPVHLLLGVAGIAGIATRSLAELGVDQTALRAALRSRSGPRSPRAHGQQPLAAVSEWALELAAEGPEPVGPERLLLALLEVDQHARSLLGDLGVDIDTLRRALVDALRRAAETPAGPSTEDRLRDLEARLADLATRLSALEGADRRRPL